MDALEQAQKLIPAEVRMISGCRDEQTSADVASVAAFQLPNPAGRAGGALTASLLQVAYNDHQDTAKDLSFQQVLIKVRNVLSRNRFTQIPQLSSSRPVDISTHFDIVPPQCTGTKRAVLIGINYTGQNGELSGCQNDVLNMIEYIKDVHGFQDENITVLMDKDGYIQPTMDNILNAYRTLVQKAEAGDAVFCHYSGHGGKLRDDNGDEKDGYDETLIPVDYERSGQIRDDQIFSTLVGAMKEGVVMTCIMDCCHSGSVLDLPYVFVADGEQDQMSVPTDFDFTTLQGLFQQFMAAQMNNGTTSDGTGPNDPISMLFGQCCVIM